MANVAFTEFVPEIALECPGVSEPAAVAAVRNAAFDFCRKSLVWQEVQDPAPYSKGVAEYDLDVPTGAQIVKVMSVVLDGSHQITPASYDQLNRFAPDWQTAEGNTSAFSLMPPSTLRFTPVPHDSGTFTATVAYAPARASTNLDKYVADRFFEVIKFGALAKLKAMAANAFTDPSGAVYYRGLFLSGTNAAAADMNRGMLRANLRVEPRSFV